MDDAHDLREVAEELADDLRALEARLRSFADSARALETTSPPPAAPASEPPQAQPEVAPAIAESAKAQADDAGARLVALNMALNGAPREETERYLDENFSLSDPVALLDDVYAKVTGRAG